MFVESLHKTCYTHENPTSITDCYTRRDFLELCQGDALKAEIVFSLSDWQHPPTILDEWDAEDEERLRQLRKERCAANSRDYDAAWLWPAAISQIRVCAAK